MLGVIGHRRASYSQEEAKALFDLTMKYARNVVIAARNERDLDYEPYEIQVFNSLDELIRKRPNASAGGLWYQVVIVTHAQAEQPKELENAIFFGDRDYDALNLLEYAATRDQAIAGLRNAIARDATLRVIGCPPASHGPELGINLREIFGTRGNVLIPKVDVDFTPTGFLGTSLPGRKKIRAIRPEEWLEIERIPEANRPD